MARNSEPVSPELKLSMTLRWLAGGSYLDIYQMHGVSYTQFNKSLWMTIDAMNDAIIISFPIDDLSALESRARVCSEIQLSIIAWMCWGS
jgi:hypothetical protein